MFQKARKKVANLLFAVALSFVALFPALLVTSPAHAAVPVAVSTALGDGATDVATVGGLVLAVIVAIVGIRFIINAISGH